MSRDVLTPLVADEHGHLWAEQTNEDGGITCPLGRLVSLLDRVADTRSDESDWTIAEDEAGSFAVSPTIEAIAAMRHLRRLTAFVAAALTFEALWTYRTTATASAIFRPLAPALRAWHSDLGTRPKSQPAQAWLNAAGWPVIVALAERRDAAAQAVVDGRAGFDRDSGHPDIVAWAARDFGHA